MYVRDLPFRVPNAYAEAAFQSLGVVHSIRSCYSCNFPYVANGTRVPLMSFKDPLPSSFNVTDYLVPVWHAGQPSVLSALSAVKWSFA